MNELIIHNELLFNQLGFSYIALSPESVVFPILTELIFS